MLLLATTRTGELEPTRDPVPIAGHRMTIPPLDVESLSRLIARELGRRLPWPVVRRIATIAAGNAFLAIELARVASTSGASPDELSPEALSRSTRIKRLAETRVRALPEPTRTALGVVAALGEPQQPSSRGRCRTRRCWRRRSTPASSRSRAVACGSRIRCSWPVRSPACLHGGGGPSTARSPTWPTRRSNARDTSPPRRRSPPPRSLRRSRTVPPARSRAGRPPLRPNCSRMRCASRPRLTTRRWGGGS